MPDCCGCTCRNEAKRAGSDRFSRTYTNGSRPDDSSGPDFGPDRRGGIIRQRIRGGGFSQVLRYTVRANLTMRNCPDQLCAPSPLFNRTIA